MSMLRDALYNLRTLLFPSGCIVCGEPITRSMHGICTQCRYDIPTTNYWIAHDNPVRERFDGLADIVEGSAFIFFAGGSLWRTLIHRCKYGGHWRIAHDMGRWYGAELRDSGLYDDIDVLIPIPLHPLKILRRTYNQSTYLAEGMARSMALPVDSRSVRRHRNNPAQARRKGSERWANVEGIFSIRHPERLRGKHILLVDDVLTTGATLTAAIRAIHAAVPDCRVSVAALAVSRHITPSR
ncbi:MAG: ComF family protein [Alistipes sp.]|nr:ComF family protein [Alistipes sp.]